MSKPKKRDALLANTFETLGPKQPWVSWQKPLLFWKSFVGFLIHARSFQQDCSCAKQCNEKWASSAGFILQPGNSTQERRWIAQVLRLGEEWLPSWETETSLILKCSQHFLLPSILTSTLLRSNFSLQENRRTTGWIFKNLCFHA